MDDDPESLTYSANMLPSGSDFNPMTRTLIWVPREENADQSVIVVFEVNDGEFRDFMRLEFQVQAPSRLCPMDPDPVAGPPVVLQPDAPLSDRVLCDPLEEDVELHKKTVSEIKEPLWKKYIY